MQDQDQTERWVAEWIKHDRRERWDGLDGALKEFIGTLDPDQAQRFLALLRVLYAEGTFHISKSDAVAEPFLAAMSVLETQEPELPELPFEEQQGFERL